jgi:small conductance mechanosensitive channel
MIRSRRLSPLSVYVLSLVLVALPIAAQQPIETSADLNDQAKQKERTAAVEELLEVGTDASDTPIDEEAKTALARVDEILAQILRKREDIVALDADARSALGDDAWALESNSIGLRLAIADHVHEIATALNELAEKGVDVSAQRDSLKQLLPFAAEATRKLYVRLEEAHRRVATDLESASVENAALASRERQLDDFMERTLSAAVAQIATLEDLGHPVDDDRSWLAKRIRQRARLAAARIDLRATWRDEAERASEQTPDDVELAAAAKDANALFQASVDSLKTVVSMMDTLELEATQYQLLVVESTGRISAEAFDRRVVGRLVSNWAESVTDGLAENGPGFVIKAIVFVLLVAFFWWLSRVARRVTERALEHASTGFSQLLERMIVSVVSSSVLAIGLLIGLSQLGIEIGPMLAGLGIAGFVLGFALQDTLSNFASGIMILAYRPYDVGDLIECAGGVFGNVRQMNLVSTTILTVDNQTRVVPNGKIWGDVITNVTAQRLRRVDMVFGISYTDDIPKAEAILSSILDEHSKVVKDPEYVVKVHELGDSSVNFVVRPWAERDDYWDVRWDVTREVKMRFDREGISIPFPQQDVHFHPASVPESASAPESGA